MAGLPNHLASLVLSSSATAITDDAPAEEFTVMHRRAVQR
jgi:hypothetical protein